MATCKTCGLDDVLGVEQQLRLGSYSYHSTANQVVSGLGVVQRVAETSVDTNSYGEIQESEIWVVIYIASLGRYFKKYGYADSYGDKEWNGRLEEVYPEERVITNYETIYERKS